MYKRYWMMTMITNGFQSMFLMYGTEDDVREYLLSEFGERPIHYHGATVSEYEAATKMGMKCYLAPEYKHD